MNYFDSVILGIIQGITEFLPVSSSGHLAVMKYFLGLRDVPVLFDVMLHVATLFVVVVMFWKRIVSIVISLWFWIRGKKREEDSINLWIVVLVIASTVITALLGLFLSGYEEKISKNPLIVACFFLVTGLFLLTTLIFKGSKGYKDMSMGNAMFIGLAQGIGVLPGISRSGITITSSLALGINRETAAEYSFLISIPAIVGAVILKLKDMNQLLSVVGVNVLIVGFITTLIVGFLSLSILLKIVKRGKLYLFSFYLIPLALLIFVKYLIFR